MNRNIELKARMPSLESGHQVAQSMGAVSHGTERQCDTYFRASQGRLKLRERWPFDSSGSPQQPCASQLIWYHRPDDATARASDYSLVVVENGVQLRDMLAGSLGVVAEIKKLRAIYLYDHVRIHLDQVLGLGSFLEFEAMVDDTCDETNARLKLDRLFTEFRLTRDSVIAGSYSDLLRC